MQPKRLSVKFFLSDSAAVEMSKVVPVFQRWIQRQTVEGLLIDVAAYEHVANGPGILLIGDEGDYSLNLNDGQPGIQYTRKRQLGDTLQESVREALRLALIASQKLTAERSLGNPAFDYSSTEIVLLDRLNAPNTAETFALLKDEVGALISTLYSGKTVTMESAHPDPRECFAVRIKTGGQIDAETLLERLEAGETINS